MRNAGFVIAYLRHNLMSAMAYRGAFLMQIVGMMLNNAIFLFFWWVLFERIPIIRGWDLQQVLLLFAVVAFGFGLATAVFGNTMRVARIIAQGELDYYLALPVDPLLHLLVSRTTLSAWGDLLFGLGLFLVVIPGAIIKLPLLILVGTMAAAVFVSFGVIVGSLAFWMGNSEHLANQALMSLITMSLYPVDFFPTAVKLLLFTLIPAAFIGAVPVRLLTDFSWDKLLIVLVVPLMVVLSRWLFFRGLRRYGSGNLVVVRG